MAERVGFIKAVPRIPFKHKSSRATRSGQGHWRPGMFSLLRVRLRPFADFPPAMALGMALNPRDRAGPLEAFWSSPLPLPVGLHEGAAVPFVTVATPLVKNRNLSKNRPDLRQQRIRLLRT